MPWSGPAEDGGMQALAAMCSHVPNKGEQMVRHGACLPLAELLQQCQSR